MDTSKFNPNHGCVMNAIEYGHSPVHSGEGFNLRLRLVDGSEIVGSVDPMPALNHVVLWRNPTGTDMPEPVFVSLAHVVTAEVVW